MEKEKSIYSYAAESGLPAGFFMTVMAACMMFGFRYEILNLVFLVLAVVFPVLLGRMMVALARREPRFGKFSALWLYGIYTVIFGVLVSSLFSGFYMTVVEPGFVRTYAEGVLEMASRSGTAGANVELLQSIMDARMLPTGMDVVVSTAWTTAFSGSLLSALLAFFVSRGSRAGRKVW